MLRNEAEAVTEFNTGISESLPEDVLVLGSETIKDQIKSFDDASLSDEDNLVRPNDPMSSQARRRPSF